MTEEEQISTKDSVLFTPCLNCSQPLSKEKYCPACGQRNANKNLSIWTLAQDFLGDYFNFDSKFFTTLIPLFTRPGQVPLDFIQGKRIRHIPPLRILIFSSFIFFFIWGLTFNPDENDQRSLSSLLNDEKANSASADEWEKHSLGATIDSLSMLPEISENNSRSERLQAELIALEKESNDMLKIDIGDSPSGESGLGNKIETMLRLIEEGNSIKIAVDSVGKENSANEKKVLTQIAKVSTSDRGTLIKYFIGNLSLIILIIQPFLALLLKLAYIRKRKQFKYIGHLIFSFYFHAWVLVLFTLCILIKQLWVDLPLKAFIFTPSFIYLLFAVHRYYAQSWPKTVMKTVIISLGYLFFIAPFFLICSFAASFYFF